MIIVQIYYPRSTTRFYNMCEVVVHIRRDPKWFLISRLTFDLFTKIPIIECTETYVFRFHIFKSLSKKKKSNDTSKSECDRDGGVWQK